MTTEALPSTQPYLLRALHEWCTDNGFTPYLAVKVDGSVQVPPEFVRNGEIVLNISYGATSKLEMGNEYIEFQARFGGVPRQIVVPIHRVMAIYASENGQGMAFSVADALLDTQAPAVPNAAAAEDLDVADIDSAAPGESGGVSSKPVLHSLDGVPRTEEDKTTDKPDPKPPTAGGKTGKRPSLRLVK
ncbi:ClpXP protease specificity-enhancing factor [Lampropedia puyangensis]|uniref:ClpXP protease specificity-enhancing factor n=1 Tax=Lampropedia puyangensis TaxID=1330072 RepID=A0A4S8F3L7_9BURK|nr:ClpXP protease specificity-enhancing factor [Lampropedia puyangensis]THU01968.1 ClpXP protease specificity-enhancing factor [Lampropedia puyangensis]